MATKAQTQAESLRGMLSSIADTKTLPDADIPFLTNMETMLLGYLRAPFEAMQQNQQVSGPGAPGMAPGQAPMLQGPVPVAPGRVPGIMNAPSMPPVDELRRLLGK